MREIQETQKTQAKNSSNGISFLSLLTLLFIGLKLTNYIDWSWWLVLAPMLIPACLFLSFILLAVVGLAIKTLIWK